MKKIISVLCVITLIMCYAMPTKAVDKLTIYSMNDISDGSISTAIIGIDDVEKDEVVSFSLSSVSDIPGYYDARETEYIPDARNQGESGACWAFATMSALEIDSCKQGLKSESDVDFSEAHLVWFTYSADTVQSSALYGEKYVSSDPYLIGGNWNRATGTLARWSGVANESDFKFYNEEKDFAKMSNYSEGGRYNRGSGVILKDVEIFKDADDVKEWIMNHGSCTASMNWDIRNYNTKNCTYFTKSSTPNHMIDIVGWDDNYSKEAFNTMPSTNGAWLVRDSRGNDLNNDGYFWLSYCDGSLMDFAGFSAQSASNYDNNYTYNAVGFSSAATCTSGSSVANIFTAKSKESLKAVSLYTITSNTKVTIKVYTGFTGVDVTKGTCINEKTVSFKNRGYHTVALDKVNELQGGTKFAVEVTYSVNTGSVEIPVEKYNTTSNGVKYTASKGQSVCCLNDATSWSDATDFLVGNFYIQAFTTDISDNPPSTESSVAIKNMSRYNNATVDYRTSITFYAECVNADNVEWHVSGAKYRINSDMSMTVVEAKQNFSVYCTAKSPTGEEVRSQTENVNVNTGFLSIFIAILRGIFGMLPNLYQK